MTALISKQDLSPGLIGLLGPACESMFGRIGHLVVRLARDESEVKAAQRLRHQVFFQRDDASVNRRDQFDADRFDPYCDHLLVVDESLGLPPKRQIVGTYRLLREESAARAGGYYSERAFDVRGLLLRHPQRRFLELGRSCVLPQYRSKRTVELLWQGIWAYCRIHGIDLMFGCASFAGTIPAAHALPLSFIHHHSRAKGVWRVKAIAKTRTPMDFMPDEAVDLRAALPALPPLIKGYLRLGAKIGDEAVVDYEFGSTDVFVILRTEHISSRYLKHFEPQDFGIKLSQVLDR